MLWRQEREPRALVVHFHNDAGVANRAGVLVSALALALATQRALLVEWPPVQAHWHPSRSPPPPPPGGRRLLPLIALAAVGLSFYFIL